jgi:hypothetical protein
MLEIRILKNPSFELIIVKLKLKTRIFEVRQDQRAIYQRTVMLRIWKFDTLT